MPETRQPIRKASSDVVFVLGAGVGRILGLPLLNTLFKGLSEFVRGSGGAHFGKEPDVFNLTFRIS